MTHPQDNPIQCADPDVNSVILASAGTGKTWLLIARILRLLLADTAPNSILAITFTKKAAFEMYERLMERAEEWTRISDKELNDSLKEIGAKPAHRTKARILYKKLIDNEPVKITTFHSFCANVMRLFPLDDEIPFKFEINDKATGNQLVNDALRELYQKANEDETLEENLNLLIEACNHKLSNAEGILRNFLDYRNTWRLLGRDIEATKKALLDSLEIKGSLLHATMQQFVTEILGDAPFSFHLSTLGKLDSIETLKLKITNIDPEQHAGEKVTYAGIEHYRNLIAELIRMLAKLPRESLDNWLDEKRNILDAYLTWFRNTAWYVCGEELLRIYEAKQKQSRSLDFSDIEYHALRLLGDKDKAVTARLSMDIEHILVDEFQDTTPEQWQLLLPLLEDIGQLGNGSIFIVGDAKQAIYGWRRADPKLLEEANTWVRDNMRGQEFHLNKSYRSSRAVINLVNSVFQSDSANESEPNEGELIKNIFDGDKPDLSRISSFETHTGERDAEGEVAVLPLNIKPKQSGKLNISWGSPLSRETTDEELSTDDIEALQVATVIKDLRGSENYQWKDFMVLGRQYKHLHGCQKIFRKLGIPWQGPESSGLAQTLEARDIIALLRFILSPWANNALLLCQVLRSPLFGISDADLEAFAQVRAKNPLDKLHTLADAHKDNPVWSDAHRLLTHWIDKSKTLPPHDLLHLIYSQRDVLFRYRRAVHHFERALTEARLKEILRLALDFREGRYPDIGEFIDYLSNLREDHKATPADTGEDSVQMLTIHGSKGLEAKVVFMVGCGGQRKEKKDRVLVDWPTGVARPKHLITVPTIKDLSQFSHAISAQTIDRNLTDRVDLLYVAMTRARDRLYVSGALVPSKKHEDWYQCIEPHTENLELDLVAPDADTITNIFKTAFKTEPEPVVVAPPPRTTAASDSPGDLSATEAHSPSAAGRTTDTGTPQIPVTDAILRGNAIHKALHLLCENWPKARVIEAVAQETQKSGGDGAMAHEWVETAEKVINNKELKDVFDDSLYVRVYNEMPLWFTADGKLSSGRVDRVCVGENSVWLIDYKTHRIADKAKADGSAQMAAYAEGSVLLWQKHAIRKSLLFTETGELWDC